MFKKMLDFFQQLQFPKLQLPKWSKKSKSLDSSEDDQLPELLPTFHLQAPVGFTLEANPSKVLILPKKIKSKVDSSPQDKPEASPEKTPSVSAVLVSAEEAPKSSDLSQTVSSAEVVQEIPQSSEPMVVNIAQFAELATTEQIQQSELPTSQVAKHGLTIEIPELTQNTIVELVETSIQVNSGTTAVNNDEPIANPLLTGVYKGEVFTYSPHKQQLFGSQKAMKLYKTELQDKGNITPISGDKFVFTGYDGNVHVAAHHQPVKLLAKFIEASQTGNTEESVHGTTIQHFVDSSSLPARGNYTTNFKGESYSFIPSKGLFSSASGKEIYNLHLKGKANILLISNKEFVFVESEGHTKTLAHGHSFHRVLQYLESCHDNSLGVVQSQMLGCNLIEEEVA